MPHPYVLTVGCMSCGSFLQGNVDKYSWVGKGGSFVMSEINAAVLHAQLESRVMINAARMQVPYMNITCTLHCALVLCVNS